MWLLTFKSNFTKNQIAKFAWKKFIKLPKKKKVVSFSFFFFFTFLFYNKYLYTTCLVSKPWFKYLFSRWVTNNCTIATYIVRFAHDTPDSVIEKQIKDAEASGATIKHRYNAAIKGFSVEVPDDSVSSLSLEHDKIEAIEADGTVTTQGKALLKE